jgi:pSer/pThr/pTyr-binding forkhead associated (FHA) protein
MPRLDFFVDYKLYLRFVLPDDSVVIGRSPECEVQLPNPRVSRQHARISRRDDGRFWLEDLSVNGIRLNAAMVESAQPLNPGDRLYIANYAIIYREQDEPTNDEEDTIHEEFSPL